MAIQRRWKTPTEFPRCPETIASGPLGEYVVRLSPGSVFATNSFGGKSTVVAAEQGNGLLAVVSNLPEGSVKPWAVSKVSVENERFVHESIGTYFTHEGAMKARCKLLDLRLSCTTGLLTTTADRRNDLS